jgi:hypothetical protein
MGSPGSSCSSQIQALNTVEEGEFQSHDHKALAQYQMLFRHFFYCQHFELFLSAVWITNKTKFLPFEQFKVYHLFFAVLLHVRGGGGSGLAHPRHRDCRLQCVQCSVKYTNTISAFQVSKQLLEPDLVRLKNELFNKMNSLFNP